MLMSNFVLTVIPRQLEATPNEQMQVQHVRYFVQGNQGEGGATPPSSCHSP